MTTALYFKVVLRDRAGDCGREIATIARDWAAKNNLPVTRQYEKGGHVHIMALSTKDKGWIEVTYSGSASGARASVYFVDDHGRRLEPAAINDMLARFSISKLLDELTRGISCALR
jgi:hypothetical protein